MVIFDSLIVYLIFKNFSKDFYYIIYTITPKIEFHTLKLVLIQYRNITNKITVLSFNFKT